MAVVKFFLDPFNLLLIFILLAILAGWLRFTRLMKVLAISALAWFVLISTPLLPTLLLDSLESRFEPVYPEVMTEEEKNAAYNIVVLGGGHGYDDRLPANSLLSLQALARLNEGVRLYKQLPNSTLILSGYSASNRIPNAVMLRDAALLLGVDSLRTQIIPEPANTYEEAKYYSERYSSEHPVILVTSASHMPRAAGVFQYFNVGIAPSPTHYRIKENQKNRRFGWPSISNISNLSSALSEYAAISRDWWLGRRSK